MNSDDYISAYMECTYLLMLLPVDQETTDICKFIINRFDEAYKDVTPSSATDFMAVAIVKMNTEEYAPALEALQSAIALDPKQHYSYKLRAYHHLMSYKIELAIQDMNNAIQIIEKGEYFDDLANMYCMLGDFDLGLKNHLKAVELAPENPRLWYNAGVLYSELQDGKEALRMFEEAVRLWPEYEDALENRNYLLNNFDFT